MKAPRTQAAARRAPPPPIPGMDVQIDAVRPNWLSFMRAIASASSRTFMMPTTGPKVSSRMSAMSWSTSTSTWGAR